MSDWYTERRQNQQLEELRGEMSRALSDASSLRSRLSQLQGGVESRLQRLTTAFDAFVELSDIRYELIGFADASEVRRHAGQVLSALASGDTPPAATREVPGYWLGPAVDALRLLSTEAVGHAAEQPGDEAEGGPLAEAMARDARRTSIFLCLALAALGRRNQVRTDWLNTAFGALAADGTVTRVQRALWTTGARGGFGADGLALIVTRLQMPATASADKWLAAVEARGDVAKGYTPNFTEIVAQAKVRQRLSRLRSAVETITGDTAVLEPDRDLAYGADEHPDPDRTSAMLRLLISEGSEPEREPLARVAELRTRITDGTDSGGGSFDDQAGAVEELLKADLGRAKEPHLAAAALRVVAAGVLAGAEELARTAGAPSPRQITTEIEWRQVTLLPDGPERQSLTAAESAITSTVAPLSSRDLAGPVTFGIAGLVVAAGLGLVHPLWIVAGLGLIAYGAYRYWTTSKRKKSEQADAAARVGRLREKSTEAAGELAEYLAKDAERGTAVATELEEIRKRLTV